MAAKLEGGAYLSSFVDAVLKKLSLLDVNSTPMARKLADQDLLQRLKLSLRSVRPVLDDAEQKLIRNDQEVKKWLLDLQDALYMADDLLDKISTKAATATPTQRDPGNYSSMCHSIVDSILEDSDDDDYEMGVADLVDKLESIVEEKNGLGLKDEPVRDLEDMSWRIESSLVESSEIFGRDNDKEAIIKLLLDDTCNAKISVIPIVGMGGVGKTTLAQLVYNDKSVDEKFAIKAWVCVSDQFDIVKVTKTLIEAAGGSSYNGNALDLLQTELKDKLKGRKFLIVLDDMWIDNSYSRQWKTLQKPFQFGKEGSKVLVTTRNDTTADVVKTVSAYKLNLLSERDCWSLFVKCVSLSPESKEYSTLEPVGRELVKKCEGPPLAVESLGALLRTNYDEEHWDRVLKSELWEVFEDQNDEIIPALNMSYHYLPSSLKRCFVYCSLFPKDCLFKKDVLVLLWMAEELLQPKEKKDLEEIGFEYFDQLVARSFFHSSSTYNNFYVIHDLIHDLATARAGEFYFRAEKLEENVGISNKTRHLLHDAGGNYPFSQIVSACDRVKYTRTFLEINLSRKDPFNMENAPHIFLSELKCLRVLSFNAFPLDSLPDSIGNLIHLRYLDLLNTRVETLPEELCCLYNLQTLKMNNCRHLKKLPSNMQDLVNLRHLDIRGASIEEMPKGMSKLKDLHFLSDYIVGKDADNNGVKELGALANIHESLHIHQLENIMDGAQALEARIADKKHLKGLYLTWSYSHSYIDDSQDILNNLKPHRNLRKLSINEYKGLTFPDWFGHSSYKNMTKLYLYGCSNCLELPSLGQLPSLKRLRLSDFRKLQRVGAKFYKEVGSSSHGAAFPVLESLSFYGMDCWEEWLSVSSELDAFPLLRELRVRNCPALRGDLPSQLPALRSLCIHRCGQLDFSLPRANALLELSVEGPQQVEAVLKAIAHNQLDCLQSLSIGSCWLATSFPVGSMPSSLQSLVINGCPYLEFPMLQQQHESLQSISIFNSCHSLTSFPLASFPNLTTLTISSCINLKSLLASDAAASTSNLLSLRVECCPSLGSFPTLEMVAPHLEHLSLGECPEIESFFEGGLPPNLRELHITHCEKLVKYLASMDLHDHCLIRLDIQHPYDNIKSFPLNGSLPASLGTLNLRNFPSLEILDCKGLDHLQSLLIERCPRMQDVAGESFPASLSMLCFNGSSLLRNRFQTNDKLILSKMSHVRNINVDGAWISKATDAKIY
ncbi:putative disease resistance protein At3g14460 isoform X1 [Arachis stenosperma]|uniref:putative disease resistance protein At3g14460 isoform X1 n=1 Tax=Arachis stenosperma TaxID=217475 RepID=UPI0025ABC6D2|nr:putative disease resistance protein At3g14460 isoform X1 [Arachis stenosperma]